jgi:hypothetical protein
MVYHDTDILLESYPLPERPHIVTWYYRPHLVIAEFPHSQTICAVQLDTDSPRIEWGSDGAPKPFDFPACYFTEWLTNLARQIDSDDEPR